MRILLLNDYAVQYGGAEVMTFALRDGLRERGHDARLLASSAGSDGDSGADYLCTGTTSSLRTVLQTANPFAARDLRRVLDTFRPHLVHVRMFLTQLSPLVLPLLRDVPSVYHVVWYRPICPIGTKLLPDGRTCHVPPGAVCARSGCLPIRDWVPLMLQMKLWRRWRDAFDLVVANSEATRRRLVAEGIQPVEVVANGVPVRAPREALASAPTALFAGRLVFEKGVDVLLRAFVRVIGELPEARLVVVGDGPAGLELRRLVAELGLEDHVTMPGRLPRQEIERRFDGSWVQVLPARWEEPFGVAAAEAMMRGTAVVATGAGGLPELVGHGRSGLLVERDNVDALAAALLRVLGDQELADALGAEGRRIALERLSENSFVEGLLALYRRLVPTQRETRPVPTAPVSRGSPPR